MKGKKSKRNTNMKRRETFSGWVEKKNRGRKTKPFGDESLQQEHNVLLFGGKSM